VRSEQDNQPHSESFQFGDLASLALAFPGLRSLCGHLHHWLTVADMMPRSMPTDHSASEILARVVETYATCRSYREDGDEQTVFITGTSPWHRRTTRKKFRTAFVRPDRLFFECLDAGVGPESEWRRGVAWADPSGAHAWNSMGIPMRNTDSISGALEALSAMSNSISWFASSLLFSNLGGRSPLPDPNTARLIGDEDVDGVTCHRIEGVRLGDQGVTIWIEAQSLLVRRIDSALEFNEERRRQIDKQVQEHMAKMPSDHPDRAMMEKGIAMRTARPQRAFQTEMTVRRRPAVNVEIDESVFAFTPPT